MEARKHVSEGGLKRSLICGLKRMGLGDPAKSVVLGLMRLDPRAIRRRRRMTSFCGQFIRQGDLCFDVGANVGSRTEIFLRLGARVVAVEPQAGCMRELQRKYSRNKSVILVQKGLDEKSGERELYISDANPISSISREWISAVTDSGRFAGYRWDTSQLITMTTLDLLIESYGVPAFCKIDVEGAELTVLKGLSRPIKALSFEFAPEFVRGALECIEHLSAIGRSEYNYSIGESMRWVLSEWVSGQEMADILLKLPDRAIFGDVYVRFLE